MTGTWEPRCRRKCSLTKKVRREGPMAGSGAASGIERGEGRGAVLLFFELFYLELGLFEAAFAGLQQRVALFEFGKKLGQGDVAGFHGFDDVF